VKNDDHNTFQGVAFALSSVLPGITYDRGMQLADKIHNTGQAIVWSGHKEQAELVAKGSDRDLDSARAERPFP